MNSRIPRTFGPPPADRVAMFRRAHGGGAQLNIPAYGLLPGQISEPTANGAARLKLGSTSDADDSFLKINADGSVSLKL